MATVNIDVRLLRKDSKWCAVARITSPNLRAPMHLYTSADVRDVLSLMSMLTAGEQPESPKKLMPHASANARKDVRRKILALAWNFFEQNKDELRSIASDVQSHLAACDKSCEIVLRARGGDTQSQSLVSDIFRRAHEGDQKSVIAARMLQEAARLLDDGRSTFRISVEIPDVVRAKPIALPMPKLAPMPMESTSGDTWATDPFAWEAQPYPYDRNGTNVLQNYQPAIAAY